ncbi:chromatin remodeling protein [Radiomyces spectabilis]|uniref:chromatin remodeling protein n=1 Tax=Radiomyces spectabilis TaxID=64574 RepID=UPI00221F7561|nr:chromatin remodeling protein [Radiomyces spectabilis]KAI8370473.1 chromatin remodeling protein [Radiomyces spectabilis]
MSCFSFECRLNCTYQTIAVEALPLELQRNFTLIRQLDESAQDLMNTVATESMEISQTKQILTAEERRKRLTRIGHLLNEALQRGEEKFALAKSTYDTVDRHCTRLDNDLQKFEDEQLIGPARALNPREPKATLQESTDTQEPSNKRRKTASSETDSRGRPKKKRGRKKLHKEEKAETDAVQGDYLSAEDSRQHAQAAISLSDLPIDPNEPLYCYCRQVSFGEMVACDNDECEIEWFHLECVGLRTPPKGKWYCKNCAAELKGKKKII